MAPTPIHSLTPLGYIRAHPFSIMALCNIVGDLGYLGYAFAAEGFVSPAKLAGAGFTMLAHVLLLAYGDEQAQVIAAEAGPLSRIILGLRGRAKQLTAQMSSRLQKIIRAKPVGIPFAILAMNGVGLTLDAVLRFQRLDSPAAASQIALGILIVAGTMTFAAADCVRTQKTADRLTKIAPSILACASFANVMLAVTTGNPFIIMAVVAFALSNIAGFFTRIDKESGQHFHS